MNDLLSERTKAAAYIMWLTTGHDNTMNLWYAAEDTACYFLKNNILTAEKLHEILGLPRSDLGYVTFVRNIAFRLYINTGTEDAFLNWNNAEMLLNDAKWREDILFMARTIRETVNSDYEDDAISRRYYKKFGV